MYDALNPAFEWLNAHPHFSGLATFIISAAESVAIIGTVVPGSVMMTAIGALAGAGVIPLWSTIIWAILGAIVGDGISYRIGYHFKGRMHDVWPFRTYPSLLESGEKFFHKHGGTSVFIGRFVGPVRALVPLVAGMLGMSPLRFYIANVISAIGWAPAYMFPGILLGAFSLEFPRYCSAFYFDARTTLLIHRTLLMANPNVVYRYQQSSGSVFSLDMEELTTLTLFLHSDHCAQTS